MPGDVPMMAVSFPRARSAPASKPIASRLSGSNASTSCAQRQTASHSLLPRACSASSRIRSICLLSSSLAIMGEH